jgi:hypothetical protein
VGFPIIDFEGSKTYSLFLFCILSLILKKILRTNNIIAKDAIYTNHSTGTAFVSIRMRRIKTTIKEL